MKKYCLPFLSIIIIIIFSACAQSPAKTQAAASASVKTEVTATVSASDLSGTDLKGTWCVLEVLTPSGKAVDNATMLQMGSGFKLELIDKGVYFVYGADGTVKGQGQYTIKGNTLTLTAGSAKTVYQIVDSNTLRSVSEDKSVTVMTKQSEPSPTVSAEDSGGPDNTDAPDDIDGPDQEVPDDSTVSSPNQTNSPTNSPA